ncbi:PTS sugar transporter subunit IIB [Cetobacterium somerae]|uniref:PTS sugar transporter subunit IIB n=1 Tax=Cetobacterium somerae TaxID=188913 RepID=UPI00211EFF58|nr:PTS sugar transporter subunit IIB [Cetobacterium somerae]MCQ9627236.1 PTS sugar transporter subunit IIB [Cetobacterium somerae]
MYKVLAACGAGMGSSQIIKMKLKKVFTKMNIEVQIDHMSIGQAKSSINNYDFVFCAEAFSKNLISNTNTKIIGLINLLSEDEIEKKILKNLENS